MELVSKNKVTFVIGHLLQGGSERVVSNLSWEMSEMGMDVAILSYYAAEPVYELHPSVKLIEVQTETGSKNVLSNILFVRHIFKQRQGVIYSFIAVFNMISIVAHIGLKSKLIVADRNDPNCVPGKALIRAIRNFLYRFADCIVVQTSANADYFRKRKCRQVKVIYNPLDLFGKNGQSLKSEKKDVVVSVGRLVEQKNQEMMIKAFERVHRVLPSYKLIIYGDGDKRGELIEFIRKYALSDCIELPGNRKDIFDEISSAKLFALSSNFEGMPNSLVEAMGLGLPVISTKVSGATDLIKDRINGELVDIDDDRTLAERMIAILKDDELQIRYGEEAVKIADELSKNNITKEWILVSEI